MACQSRLGKESISSLVIACPAVFGTRRSPSVCLASYLGMATRPIGPLAMTIIERAASHRERQSRRAMRITKRATLIKKSVIARHQLFDAVAISKRCSSYNMEIATGFSPVGRRIPTSDRLNNEINYPSTGNGTF